MYILCCSKMPEKDADSLTLATRLLAKHHEMAEVERALSSQKEVKQCLLLYTLCFVYTICSVYTL